MTKYRYYYDYCGVVNMETFIIYLFLVPINDLDVSNTDVSNSHLHKFNKNKIYTVSGLMFGEQEGSILTCER